MHQINYTSAARSRALRVLALSAMVALVAGCGGAARKARVADQAPQELEPSLERLIHSPEYRDAAVLLAWNELAVRTAHEVDGYKTFRGRRMAAMMHLAIHDALNAIVPVYEPYALTESHGEAHPTAAVSRAARDVLVEIYPDRKGDFDALHEEWLAKVPDGPAKTRGTELGAKAAARLIEERANDRWDSEREFTSGSEPGEYRITAPFEKAFGTGWADTVPFALESPDQFRSGPPPDLTSEHYARAFREAASLGGKVSERTEEQTHIGHWWAEFWASLGPRIARILVDEHDLHLWRAARLFALLGVDNFDGLVSVFDSKYHYTFWRPTTGIHEAANDGNPATEPDPDWEPEMVVPPHPDYPSAHALTCRGGVEMIVSVFGTSELSFTVESRLAPEGGPKTRSYDDIYEASEHCGLSRIYNGYHFRFSIDAGVEMARARATYLLENHLVRALETSHPELAEF